RVSGLRMQVRWATVLLSAFIIPSFQDSWSAGRKRLRQKKDDSFESSFFVSFLIFILSALLHVCSLLHLEDFLYCLRAALSLFVLKGLCRYYLLCSILLSIPHSPLLNLFFEARRYQRGCRNK